MELAFPTDKPPEQPRAHGTRLPAEWERHERTLMGWPCRPELWGETIGQARSDYATVANAIAEFEPVTMIANPGADARQARAACSSRVEIMELPLNDSWLRDCGPIYVRGPDGRRAIHFRFNAWGGKFPPWDADAAVGGLIAERLGDPVVRAPLVLEGGSICANGDGVILTTEQCLLNPNRNPDLSRAQIEEALRNFLGADKTIWLGQGLLEDRDTDGHVDLIAAFTRPDQVLLQTVRPDNANFENCEQNRARLEAAGLAVLEMPHLPYATVAGETVASGYLNFYICNGAVIVPAAGVDTDTEAMAIIAAAYPGREVVPVPGVVLAFGGGGPHCITQQVPTTQDTRDD
jgi:agmatine deiminase